MLPPAAYLDTRIEDTGRPTVELGWASTVHSAQGRTVDQAIMVVDENTEDLADLIRAAVQSPTASEVVLDAGPHPPDTGQSRGPGRGRPEPGDRRAATARGGTRTDRSRGPGQRGRPGRTAAGVGRPDAGGCRPIGGRSTRPNSNSDGGTDAGKRPHRKTARLSINDELQGVRAQNKTLPEQSRAYTKQRKAEQPAAGTDPRVGTADTRRPPHRRSANSGIVETWEISPEAALVLGRYQQLEAARLQPARPGPAATGPGRLPKSGSNHP